MHRSIYVIVVVALCSLLLAGCDQLISTRSPDSDQTLAGPIDGLTPAQLAAHIRGDEEFGRIFGSGDGLGPVFVNTSCEGCHLGDGKGASFIQLTRFGMREQSGAFNPLRHLGGPQLQQRSIAGYPAESIPSVATGRSVLLPPAVTGLGLLANVPDAQLLALADPNDADADGISGVPQFVDPPDYFTPLPSFHVENNGQYIGRFGRKAGAITLLQQVAEAYLNDIGITSDFLIEDLFNVEVGPGTGDHVPDPEVPAATVRSVEFYIRTLKPPPRRNVADSDVLAGEMIFDSIKCTSCHVPSLTTGPSDVAPLSNVRFSPYTDLLLHDMGPELDDAYTEGSALSSEWRTTPLWGLGLSADAQGGRASFLHDGRAHSIEGAIELHGGEASSSRAAFRLLSPTERAQLLKFLRSL